MMKKNGLLSAVLAGAMIMTSPFRAPAAEEIPAFSAQNIVEEAEEVWFEADAGSADEEKTDTPAESLSGEAPVVTAPVLSDPEPAGGGAEEFEVLEVEETTSPGESTDPEMVSVSEEAAGQETQETEVRMQDVGSADLFTAGEKNAAVEDILFTELNETTAQAQAEADRAFDEETEEDPALFTGTLSEIEVFPEPEAADDDAGLLTALVSLPETFLPEDLPPVRNQFTTGMCWAFTTAASMEIWLKRQGEGEYDLSEEHLSYFLLNRTDDPLHNTAGDSNSYLSTAYAYPFRHGGSQILASLGLATWSGFDLEENAPLGVNSSGDEIDPSLDASRAYATTAYLTEAAFAGSSSQYKDMINEYGSVGVSIRYDKNYLKKETSTGIVSYSFPTEGLAVNHAVTLVGWDDNFSKDHFAASAGVTSDGAYLARNSWGEGWGDKGYFYISYECKGLKNAVSVKGTTHPNWKNNYFYDGTNGLFTSDPLVLRPYSDTVQDAVANVFRVKAGAGVTEALGEIVLSDIKAGSTYGIQIYTNLTDPSNPYSGKAVFDSPQPYYHAYAGIGTFTLPAETVLVQDSCFAVVVTNLGGTDAKLLKEKSGSGSNGQMVWKAQIDQQQSLQYTASANGSWEWRDLSADGCCARIKAHTRTLTAPAGLTLNLTSDRLMVGETTKISAGISGGLTKGTYTLTLGSSNKNIATVSANGMITAVAPGTVTITSTIKGTGISATAMLTVEGLPSATPSPQPVSPEDADYDISPTPTPVPTAVPAKVLPTATPVPVITVTPAPVKVLAAPASVQAKALNYKKFRWIFPA